MGTYSTIAIKFNKTDGFMITCHSDGYIETVGRILLEHYKTEKKITGLMKLGNLSKLHKDLEPDPTKKHDFYDYQPDVVVAYGRDRGDEGEEALVLSEIEMGYEDPFIEFNYVFTDGSWFINGEPLTKELVDYHINK